MAADDLAAADAVGVGEHDVERLDLGMGVEEGLGFIEGGTGRRIWMCSIGESLAQRTARLSHAARRSAISPKAATRRSTWGFVVAGETSIMLWNGAISDAAIDQRDMDRCFQVRRMRGFRLAAVPQRTGRADEFDARADPRHMPGQAVAAMVLARPFSSRAARRSICA